MGVELIRFDELPMRRAWRLLASAGLIIAAAAAFCWPMIVNRQPFLLSDTTSYIRGADAAAFRVTGVATDWTDTYLERFGGRSGRPAAVPRDDHGDRGRPVTLAGRSIYYGFFLLVADRLGGLRLAAFLQALLTAVCVFATLARFRRHDEGRRADFLFLIALLSVVTPLAFFACYLVPDLFTGVGILAAAHLLSQEPPMRRGWRTSWFLVLCVSGLVHSSNILILLIVLVTMLARRVRSDAPDWPKLVLLCAGLLVALGGEVAFYKAVQTFTGDPPVRPPFVMARLIADGPGRDYLKEHCPEAGFAVCDHLASLSPFSDSFLWSARTSDGVFTAVGDEERRRIASEEGRFVLAVARDRPLAVLRSSASSIVQQALKWRLREFNYVSRDRSYFIAKLPARILREQSPTLAFHEQMPVRLVESLTLPAALLSFVLLLWAVIVRRLDPALRLFVVVLVIASVADVAVCGALSTPHHRYLMRVAWLLPLGAYLGLIARSEAGQARGAYGSRGRRAVPVFGVGTSGSRD